MLSSFIEIEARSLFICEVESVESFGFAFLDVLCKSDERLAPLPVFLFVLLFEFFVDVFVLRLQLLLFVVQHLQMVLERGDRGGFLRDCEVEVYFFFVP